MEQIKAVLRQMIEVSDAELEGFLQHGYLRQYRRKSFLCEAGQYADSVFFVNKGILRVMMLDLDGVEHTLHFALENQFIADYASFLQRKPAVQNLQAIEDVEVVVLPRSAVEWGYRHLKEGERLGRLIAEYYFIYLDHRITRLLSETPAARYANIESTFPDIHLRAPQRMIASYLGITPVHLSRLKKMRRS
jgi:CRP-like cAMP-binding protein